MGTSDNNYNAEHDNDDDDLYYSNTSLPQEYYFGGTVVNAAVGVVSAVISDIITRKPVGVYLRRVVDRKETQNEMFTSHKGRRGC
jgi:hypothetical protein